MGRGFRTIRVMILSATLFLPGILLPQTPPPESASKVKRVLLYNLTGGWMCTACSEKTDSVFLHMAQSKGFRVDITSYVGDLTLENLKRYQVIVWNNNTDGMRSVPDSMARNAVSEYVRQGGGWMLVNIANQHGSTWPFLESLIGPGTSGWQGESVSAVLVADSAAKQHPELRYLVMALPDSIPLQTNWLNTNLRIHETGHISNIYKVRNREWSTGDPDPLGDYYIVAGARKGGKALSIPLGWEGGGMTDIMSQADSAVPRLYWQGLRWLAGDFQNGCTNPDMPDYDPEARVDDGSCQFVGIRPDSRLARNQVKIAGRRLRFGSPVAGGSRMRLLDLRGHAVWKFTAPHIAHEIGLPDGLLPGLYFLESVGTELPVHTQILVP